MWKHKYEALEQEHNQLKTKFEELRKSMLPGRMEAAPAMLGGGTGDFIPIGESDNGGGFEAVYRYVKQRLLAEKDPGILELLSRRPEIQIKVERPVVQMDESTLRGRIVRLLSEGFFDSPTKAYSAYVELRRRGVSVAKPTVYSEMDKLTTMGVVTKEGDDGYRKSPEVIIKRV